MTAGTIPGKSPVLVEERRLRPAGGDASSSSPSPVATPPGYQQALLAIHRQRNAYLQLNRRVVTDAGYQEPGAFCRGLIARLFADPEMAKVNPRSRFLRWAAEQAPTCKLAVVLAAVDALDHRDYAAARFYADQALTLVQNNLHIQSMHRAALRRGTPEESLAGRFCRAPFQNLETAPNRDVYFCCPSWLPVPIGNLDHQSTDEIWNSPAAQAIRQSVHDGSYRYCSRMHCPHLSQDSLPRIDEVANQELRTFAAERAHRLPRGPRRITLSHDRSCNLSCPSCRTELIVARKEEQARLNALIETTLRPLLADARKLHVTASGDPFGSAHFRHLLKRLTKSEFPRLRISLQTNGQLFDRNAWRELELAGKVETVAVSIDAASEATYAIVRRGGDFSRLIRNLDFLAELRRAGEIDSLRLDFVVQRLNFREMAGAVALARRLGCDRVKFQMIRNWGTYASAEFDWHNIGSPANPDFPAFVDVLANLLRDPARLEFWGMGLAVRDARARESATSMSVENPEEPGSRSAKLRTVLTVALACVPRAIRKAFADRFAPDGNRPPSAP